MNLVHLLSGCLLVGAAPLAQQDVHPEHPFPIEVGAVSRPGEIRQSGGRALVYELIVSNPRTGPMTVEELQVSRGRGGLIASIAGTDWPGIVTPLPIGTRATFTRQGLRLGSGGRALLYLWLEVPEGELPESLCHELIVVGDLEGAEVRWAVTGPTLQVRSALVIDAPVRGGEWLVNNGLGDATNHRRFFVVHGEYLIPQRFGADFHKLAADGNNASNEGLRLEDFHSYDVPLHAVADGEVVVVHDVLDDNPAQAPPLEFAWDDVPGNHVILRIAPEAYAMYVHLRPGSIRVRPGERVERGQVIAAIGNTGNVSAPHLHFHVGDRPHVNSSQGIPIHFRSFESLLDDYVFDPAQLPWVEHGLQVEAGLPRTGSVVRFPR